MEPTTSSTDPVLGIIPEEKKDVTKGVDSSLVVDKISSLRPKAEPIKNTISPLPTQPNTDEGVPSYVLTSVKIILLVGMLGLGLHLAFGLTPFVSLGTSLLAVSTTVLIKSIFFSNTEIKTTPLSTESNKPVQQNNLTETPQTPSHKVADYFFNLPYNTEEEQNKWIKEWEEAFVANANAFGISSKQVKLLRAPMFEMTRNCAKSGFHLNGQKIQLNQDLHNEMVNNSKLYNFDATKELLVNNPPSCATEIFFAYMDSVQMAQFLKQKGAANPVILNFMDAYTPGGAPGWSGTQEEALQHRSNYRDAIEALRGDYPIEKGTVIYSPNVQFFRQPEIEIGADNKIFSYEFMNPIAFGVVGAAAYDLRPSSKDAIDLNSPEYETKNKDQIRAIIRVAILEKHDAIVLGPLGGGAFLNPIDRIAGFFKDVIIEFDGQIKFIGFPFAYKNKEQNRKIFEETFANKKE